jgi:hypothetical protein
MKNFILLLFIISFYYRATCQNNNYYLQVELIGKIDYVNILDEYFLPVEITNRIQFNHLISNDSILLSILNDTTNRIYFHEDLVQTEKDFIFLGYQYNIPINEELEIQLRLVKGELPFRKRKFFKPINIPLFNLDDLFIDYEVVKVKEIYLMEKR